MPFTAERIGAALAAPATEFELARNVGKNPDFFCLRRAGQMHHTLWDFVANNALIETIAQSDPSGTHLAIAAYDTHRILSMHRPSGGKLTMQVYETGGFFALEDELPFNSDTQPQILPFGAPTRAASQVAGHQPASKRAPKPLKPLPSPAPPGSGSVVSNGGAVSTRRPGKLAKVEPVGDFTATLQIKIGRAVVGSLTSGGQLRLTSWAFQGGGDVAVALGFGASTLTGAVKSFSLAKVQENRKDSTLTGLDLVAAVRGTDDKLKVQRWRLTLGKQGVPSAFAKIAEVVAPEAVTAVSCCAVQALGGTQVVTAVRTSSGGALKVIAWQLDSAGGLTRLSSATAGGITSAVDVAAVKGAVFVTGVREADERFKCTFWRFPTTSDGAVEHLAHGGEGKIDDVVHTVAFSRKSPQVGDAIFAVREQDVTGLRFWRYRLTES